MLSKDKLIYDGTTPADGDSVAAFLHASLKLTSTTLGGKEALDINIAGFDNPIDVNLVSPITVDVDLKGIYDVGTNPTPDNVGLIGTTRGATDETGQVKRLTAGSPASDAVDPADIMSLDVSAFGMLWNGTGWDRMKGTSGIQDVNPTSAIADDDVDSGNPMKVGSRAVSGALSAVSASGDRADLISDLYRRIWMNNSPNVAGSNAAVSVDTTAGGVAVFASPLDGRMKAQIQNLGSKAIYIGFGTVSAANGLRIAAGATETIELGPNLALKAIAESGTQDVRVLQLA